jgi:hypothetical protein
MLNVIALNVVMLGDIVVNIVMLNVIILNVVILNGAAPTIGDFSCRNKNAKIIGNCKFWVDL